MDVIIHDLTTLSYSVYIDFEHVQLHHHMPAEWVWSVTTGM